MDNILYFQTKRDTNGNTKQLIVDLHEKTIQRGYNLFNSCFKTYTTLATKKDYETLYNEFTLNGFTHLIKL